MLTYDPSSRQFHSVWGAVTVIEGQLPDFTG
jgi:hypothetical protein